MCAYASCYRLGLKATFLKPQGNRHITRSLCQVGPHLSWLQMNVFCVKRLKRHGLWWHRNIRFEISSTMAVCNNKKFKKYIVFSGLSSMIDWSSSNGLPMRCVLGLDLDSKLTKCLAVCLNESNRQYRLWCGLTMTKIMVMMNKLNSTNLTLEMVTAASRQPISPF